MQLARRVVVRHRLAVGSAGGQEPRQAVVVQPCTVRAHEIAIVRKRLVLRSHAVRIRGAGQRDRQRRERFRDALAALHQRGQLRARVDARENGAERLDREPLELVAPADLSAARPARERRIDEARHGRQIRFDRLARERRAHRPLPRRMRCAVEVIDDARAAEQRLHVRRVRAVAHDVRRIVERLDRLRPDQHDRLAPEQARAKDSSIRSAPRLHERERVLGERERLTDARESHVSRREHRGRGAGGRHGRQPYFSISFAAYQRGHGSPRTCAV